MIVGQAGTQQRVSREVESTKHWDTEHVTHPPDRRHRSIPSHRTHRWDPENVELLRLTASSHCRKIKLVIDSPELTRTLIRERERSRSWESIVLRQY